ncbi:MAG: glutaredoxin family protein [Candidatus Hydrogenedentes bacterium]|nr:glutaredoxin family protein [Candidatus Hydrogenedentota bacterium]
MITRRPHIEVFTQACCASCARVESYLEERGVEFVMRDIANDPAALDELVSQGYMTTPVTRIGDTWVAGFKRRALDKLLAGAMDANGEGH